ncbi:MAG TPA: hypothetical protein VEI80_00880, partial [Candidatus Acidoferrales bacterium]|nr:hypothetical protein [Candidatus Acidoferrales bacterium]
IGRAFLRMVSVRRLKSARKAKNSTTIPRTPNSGLMNPRNRDTDAAAAAAMVCECRYPMQARHGLSATGKQKLQTGLPHFGHVPAAGTLA